ncbi:type II secretion system protein [Cerasicoccus frondis]|uniref:type II secretion system protein n=1 Tax=Cerasicoccus frondis TaxID=490090 RepID=UPI0028529DAD|nr:type II secretion system protein [Cerasicoccus frondis]
MKDCFQERKPSCGFSLIELITAVAIIAVLASLLIPVVGSVRKRAKISTNLSNLRMIQLANILYANDHNGSYIPVGSFDEDGKYGSFWFTNENFIENYVGLELENAQSMLVSPLATYPTGAPVESVGHSYGYNFTGLGAYGVANSTREATVYQVVQPSQKLAFADAVDWQIQLSGAARYVGSNDTLNERSNNAIAYRYDDHAGVVYFDGHTAMLSREDVIDNLDLWALVGD